MSFMHQPRSFGKAINKRQADDFARLRSRYVDVFSQAELRLSQLYTKLGLRKQENSVGLKLGELNNLKASSTMSKAKVKQVQSICSELAKQVKIRNGLAHATMSVGTKSGEDVSFFQKASDAADSYPAYFVMSYEDFISAIDEIGIVAGKIETLLNPPPSQPQPSQGAAAGP